MLLVAGASAACGALGMWFFLQPQRAGTAAPKPAAPLGGMPSAPTAVEPSPELTRGMPPAQAARTLGNFFYDQHDWARAIVHYTAAIRDGSDDADIRTDYANALQFDRRFAEAAEQYRTAQKMDPAHEASLFNFGVLLSDGLRDPAGAIATWEEFLRRFPASARAAAARDGIERLRAASAGQPPAAPAPVAPGATAPSDADLQRMMQHMAPAKPAP